MSIIDSENNIWLFNIHNFRFKGDLIEVWINPFNQVIKYKSDNLDFLFLASIHNDVCKFNKEILDKINKGYTPKQLNKEYKNYIHEKFGKIEMIDMI